MYKENWEEQQIYIYWLTSVEGIGSRTIEKLLQYAGNLKSVYEMNLPDMMEIIPQSKAKALIYAKTEYDIWERYEKLEKSGVSFYSVYHPDYPQRLKDIPDKPYGIYVEGKLPKERVPSVAVIGARQCSSYGRFMAEICGRELAGAGVNVISGMARGIDGISQKAALDAGGKTYAILGCGTNICYPPENSHIYRKAKESGAVISEYPPGTPPAPGLFPAARRKLFMEAEQRRIRQQRVLARLRVQHRAALLRPEGGQPVRPQAHPVEGPPASRQAAVLPDRRPGVFQVVHVLDVIVVVDRVLDNERRAMLRRVQGQIAEAPGPPLLPENRIADVPDGERFLPVPVDMGLAAQNKFFLIVHGMLSFILSFYRPVRTCFHIKIHGHKTPFFLYYIPAQGNQFCVCRARRPGAPYKCGVIFSKLISLIPAWSLLQCNLALCYDVVNVIWTRNLSNKPPPL